jgi:hypothetical protein
MVFTPATTESVIIASNFTSIELHWQVILINFSKFKVVLSSPPQCIRANICKRLIRPDKFRRCKKKKTELLTLKGQKRNVYPPPLSDQLCGPSRIRPEGLFYRELRSRSTKLTALLHPGSESGSADLQVHADVSWHKTGARGERRERLWVSYKRRKYV